MKQGIFNIIICVLLIFSGGYTILKLNQDTGNYDYCNEWVVAGVPISRIAYEGVAQRPLMDELNNTYIFLADNQTSNLNVKAYSKHGDLIQDDIIKCSRWLKTRSAF